MDVPVLIEPVPGKGFVARAGSPFDWMAEGATEAEAMANLQAEASLRLANGSRIALLTVANGSTATADSAAPNANGIINPAKPDENPWLRLVGTLDPNDPMVQEWRQAIEEYRREIDNDPDVY